MNKSLNIIRYVAIGLGFLVFLFIFLPLYDVGGTPIIGVSIIFGYGSANFDIFSFLAFLFPAVAATLLLIKTKHSEALAMMFFLLAGFSLILLPDFVEFVSGTSFHMQGQSAQFALTIIQTTYVIAIIISFLGAILSLTLANAKSVFTTYQIVEMAMLVSLAIVLDLPGLKIRIGTAGGSIGFTMLPLLLLALRQGPIKGFIGTGIVYGFATCILDGWGLVYYPFDYLLGYGSLALLGIFSPLIINREITKFNVKGMLFLILGTVIAVLGRLLASTLSGIIYFELNFWGSLVYNISYILPSAGIVLVVLIGLYDPMIRMNKMIGYRLDR